MYLKALEIQGFKSFPDRTRIEFERGITAVVGPNGSGKSNISDAIRWVLGETSAKQLRGGGKMENVIFGGTPKRSAMGYASVKMVMDNTDRRFQVDADEVTIGRKYYRSGESEYSINGQNVRLKDVYELLLDTGLGRDGYSVIGQGRIAEIVGAKSAERREIFEEASGISRFRYRKNEAERRLSSAEENLVRLRDILGELEDRVGPLEKECAKAEKFLELSAQRKTMEVTLWVDTVKSTRETLRGQQRKVEIAQSHYDSKGKEIDAIDEETQEIRLEIEKIIVEIDRSNAAIRSLQEEIGGRGARVAVLRNDIEHNMTSIAQLEEEIEQSGSNKSQIALQIEENQQVIRKAEQEYELNLEKIRLLEARLTEIQSQSMATGERKGEIQAKLAALTEEVTNLKVSEAAAGTSVESSDGRLVELQERMDKIAQDAKVLEEQKQDTEVMLEKTNQELQKLENIKGGLSLKMQARQDALQQADKEEREVTSAAESARQRISMLKELENNMDGFQYSVKSVIKAARNGQLRGVVGPVSSILQVTPGYEAAIETALGFALQNIVVTDENAAKAGMMFLKETRGGRATFLPLDTVKPQRLDATLPQGAVSAQNLVQYDEKYKDIISSLLARVVVVEDINEASRVARQLNYRNRIVTRDGQVINAGGSFTGGSVSKSAGLFSRKQEIDDLTAKLVRYEEKKNAAINKTDEIKAEVDRLNAELTAVGSENITFGGDKIRCEGELNRIEQSIAVAQQNLANCMKEKQAMEENILQAKQQQEEYIQRQKQLANEIEIFSTELTSIAGNDNDFLAGRESLSEQLSQMKMDGLNLEHSIDLHKQNVETLQSRTGEGDARTAALLLNIERLQKLNAENEENITTVEKQAEEGKEKIAQMEQANQQLAASRIQKEGSITEQLSRERSITAEREELGREIARLTEQKTAMETSYDNTITQLWDEYELTLSDAENICVPFESANELRREVGEIRNRIRSLGHVNVGAIEEFAEVNERYTFLKKQVGDVEKSKAELEKMIAELCSEMTTIFGQSFTQINENFGRIFKELFGGGRGNLFLSDPDNILESGIEIEVAPPGKIIKDLVSLSGGEQALVAICIYFAILAVNPAPFCVLDEIEAALDDANVVRYAKYLRRINDRTQFIAITHRRGTMEEADVLYGVTMQEDGVSKLLRLNVDEVDASLVK